MKRTWTVKVFDNFGAPGEGDVTSLGVHASAELALRAAREHVRSSLHSMAYQATSVKDLISRFSLFGEEPVVFSNGGGKDVEFSARDFAKAIASEVFSGRHETAVSTELRAAYRATQYVVQRPDGEQVIRIGDRALGVDEQLATIRCRTAVFLSAANPMSVKQPDAVNTLRHQELLSKAEKACRVIVPGEGRSDDGAWSETSVLLLGLDHSDAIQLARYFDQAAFVWLAVGEPAALHVRTLANQYVDDSDLDADP